MSRFNGSKRDEDEDTDNGEGNGTKHSKLLGT